MGNFYEALRITETDLINLFLEILLCSLYILHVLYSMCVQCHVNCQLLTLPNFLNEYTSLKSIYTHLLQHSGIVILHNCNSLAYTERLLDLLSSHRDGSNDCPIILL